MNTTDFLRIIRIICFIICVCLPCVTNAQDDLIENWWDNNTLIVKGYGFSKRDVDNTNQEKMLTRRAAITDGYRQLAEQAEKIHITAEETLGSQIKAGDISKRKIDAVIKGAKILSEEFDENNNCIVVMSVPIYGVTNSVANVIFKPISKENFPSPTKDEIAEGNYTGLIIDCSDLDLNPVLLPVIRNEGNQTVYSRNNLDHNKVISNGMVSYAINTKTVVPPAFPSGLSIIEHLPLSYTKLIENKILLFTNLSYEKNLSRAGDNPLIVKATGISDDNTCPIISEEDSDKILAENQASHFLDNTAVVFTSYRVGGIRV